MKKRLKEFGIGAFVLGAICVGLVIVLAADGVKWTRRQLGKSGESEK